MMPAMPHIIFVSLVRRSLFVQPSFSFTTRSGDRSETAFVRENALVPLSFSFLGHRDLAHEKFAKHPLKTFSRYRRTPFQWRATFGELWIIPDPRHDLRFALVRGISGQNWGLHTREAGWVGDAIVMWQAETPLVRIVISPEHPALARPLLLLCPKIASQSSESAAVFPAA